MDVAQHFQFCNQLFSDSAESPSVAPIDPVKTDVSVQKNFLILPPANFQLLQPIVPSIPMQPVHIPNNTPWWHYLPQQPIPGHQVDNTQFIPNYTAWWHLQTPVHPHTT